MTQAEPRLLTRTFVLLMTGHFLQALGYSSMVLLPLYLDDLKASRTEIGLIMATAAVGGLALRPAVGWALDAVGRRATLIGGTVLLASSLWGIGLIDSIGPLIYLDRVVYGVGVATLFAGYFTFASDIIPAQRRTEGIAIFGVSGLAPLALMPLLRSGGIEAAALRWAFPAIGVVIFSSVIALWLVREPVRPKPAARFSFTTALRAVRRRSLWPVWLATMIFATLIAVFMTYATITAEHRDVSMSAGMWATYAGGAAVVRLFGGRLPDRVGPERMVAPALGLYIVAALVASQAMTTGGFLLAGALAGVAHGYCFPVLTSQVVSRVPDDLRGSGMTSFTALWDLSALIFTPLFGTVADTFGDTVLFASAAAFAALGVALWWPLERALGERSASAPASQGDETEQERTGDEREAAASAAEEPG